MNRHLPGHPLVPRKDLGQESPLPVPGYPKLRHLARRRDEVPGYKIRDTTLLTQSPTPCEEGEPIGFFVTKKAQYGKGHVRK